MNLAELLYSSAERHTSRPAVTDVASGRSLDYGQLAREARRVAAFLIAQGVEPGHRIGLMAPNSLAYLPAAFGLLATGACLTPLATHLTPAEAAQITTEVQVNGRLSWPKADRLSGGEGGAVMSGGECDGLTFQWTDRDAAGPVEFTQLNPAFAKLVILTANDEARGSPPAPPRAAKASCCHTKRPLRASEPRIPCCASRRRTASCGCCRWLTTSR